MHNRIIPCLGLLFTVGCVGGQDPYWRVEDLRILAIRADPPELLDSRVPADIQFTALVADPTAAEGEAITLEWEFCPVQSGRACSDYETILATTAETQAGVTSGLDFGGAATGGTGGGGGGGGGIGANPWEGCALSPGTLIGFASFVQAIADISVDGYLTERFRGPQSADSFALTTTDLTFGIEEPVIEDGPQLRRVDLGFFDGLADELRACDPALLPPGLDTRQLPEDISDLHLYHFFANPLGALLGATPSVVLTARSGEQTLVGQKRINLTFRRPASPIALFQFFAPDLNFGVPFCVEGQPPIPGCLSVSDRTPNSNPVFSDIRVGQGKDARVRGVSIVIGAPGGEGGGPLDLEIVEVESGQAIRVLPIFTEASFESFQSVNIDLQTQGLELAEATEGLSVSWFVTAGSLQDQITHPMLTKSLDTAYTAPSPPPEETEGRVRMWLVARDQRGGTSWQEIMIQVVEG